MKCIKTILTVCLMAFMMVSASAQPGNGGINKKANAMASRTVALLKLPNNKKNAIKTIYVTHIGIRQGISNTQSAITKWENDLSAAMESVLNAQQHSIWKAKVGSRL